MLSTLPLLLLLCPSVALASGLAGYVRHHQMLYYSPVSPGRSRRSAAPPLQLRLPVGDRLLSLRLVPDTETLAADLSYSGPSGSSVGAGSVVPLYTGWVLEEPGSQLFGGLIDGVFDGTIWLRNETLVVERAVLHVDGGPAGHSFVYRASDMVLPRLPDGHQLCGVADIPDDPPVPPRDTEETATVDNGDQHHTAHSGQPRHSAATFTATLKQWRDTDMSRTKRANFDERNENRESDEVYQKLHPDEVHNRTLCSVYLETDPALWKHMFERERGNVQRTEVTLQWLAGSHLQAVNRVYRKAIFDGKHPHREYRFQIQKLVVTDDHTCLPNFSGQRSRLCFDHVGSSAFLHAHSGHNFDSFCLAFAISYHDFDIGRIGLAFIGKPWNGAGVGICARHAITAFHNPETGVLERKPQSLNTGIITLRNEGRLVHPLVSQLTLAHEIGHSMGSPHDSGAPGSPCLPNDSGGNFIMFYLKQGGHLPRHHTFSNCSVGNISRVLDYIADRGHFNCFAEKGSPFCGNGVVESGEQCDCGLTIHDCRDRCCWPRHPPPSAGPRRKTFGCRHRPGAACSPSQGPCCDLTTCATVPAEANITCRPADECTLPSLCDGGSTSCPQSPRRPDLTPCGGGSRVCQSGRCTGSVCLSAGLLPCQLTAEDAAGDRSRLCQVGCRTHQEAPCLLRAEWRLQAGAPCDGDRGVCDALLRCRPLAAEGPLARLEALLRAGDGATRLLSGWWLTALLALLLAACCALLLRCVALHIPSSNPNKPAPRTMMQTLRVPLSTFFGLSGGGDLEL